MKSITIVVLLCYVAAIQAISRIGGGNEAPEGGYPYQVAIKEKDLYVCGGSILNKRYILTSAFCVKEQKVKDIKILVGTNKLEGGEGKLYDIESYIYHEKYNLTGDSTYSSVYDIALIRVKSDIEFNDKVKPVALPTSDFNKVDYPAKLSGWGYQTSYGAKPPNNLQEITLNVIGKEACNQKLGGATPLLDSQICTLEGYDIGACYLDNGSPLVADGVQIGIFSYLVNSCHLGYPDVYTKVYNFLDYIKENVKDQ